MKIDMTLCPLCGQSNNCAIEIEKSTAQKQEPCWCVSVEFPKELLAQLGLHFRQVLGLKQLMV